MPSSKSDPNNPDRTTSKATADSAPVPKIDRLSAFRQAIVTTQNLPPKTTIIDPRPGTKPPYSRE